MRAADTPRETLHSLRAKAAELDRLSETARDAVVFEELKKLAALYRDRAEELERALDAALEKIQKETEQE